MSFTGFSADTPAHAGAHALPGVPIRPAAPVHALGGGCHAAVEADLMRRRPEPTGGEACVLGALALMFCVLAAAWRRAGRSWPAHAGAHALPVFRHPDGNNARRVGSRVGWRMGTPGLAWAVALIFVAAACVALIAARMGAHALPVVSIRPAAWVPAWVPWAGGLVLLVGLKVLLYGGVNSVFFDRAACRRWLSNCLLVPAFSAYLLYPMALVCTFSVCPTRVAAIYAILIGAGCEILLFVKFMTNFKVGAGGYLLIFLYFCSVEVLPLLILRKLAMQWVW